MSAIHKLPRSFRILQGLTLVVFVLSAWFLIITPLIDVVPQKVTVRTDKHEVIGYAMVPHDDTGETAAALCLALISGLQLWSLRYLRRLLLERTEAANKLLQATADAPVR